MIEYAKGDRWVIYHGDSLAILPRLPRVHAVITDPPYSSGGAMRGDRMAAPGSKYLQSDSKQAKYLPQFAGDNRDQRAYLAWCGVWLGMCLDLAAPGCAICCFSDWRQLPTTTDALQVGGWVWRGILPWVKPNPRPVAGRFMGGAEFVAWGSAGPMRDTGPCLPGHFNMNPDRDREHVTQKPVVLMQGLCEVAEVGGVVLDPFMGSGTTGVGALLGGRRFIGIERTEEYCAIAARRLAEASGGMVDRADGQMALVVA